jgi:hypothetical protein
MGITDTINPKDLEKPVHEVSELLISQTKLAIALLFLS